MKNCMYSDDAAQALTKAKLLLKKKFCDEHCIIDSVVTKAVEWPDIKPEDKDELHHFAMFVTELHNLAKDLGMEQEINHSQNIRMITAKLPYELRDRWRNVADDIQEEKRTVIFDDVTFINKQARIVCNPVYGGITKTVRRGKVNTKLTPRVVKSSVKTSFSTIVGTEPELKGDSEPASIAVRPPVALRTVQC